ncbi:MAG: hypothetical protein H6621_09260 [Halobacteriovoraceae bacterium]|nr:hypothetical protein [Halobacteriovoraceae bacterium]MCB9095243.1 hypothetical protein [Halobacteriovoraceae bacterium]
MKIFVLIIFGLPNILSYALTENECQQQALTHFESKLKTLQADENVIPATQAQLADSLQDIELHTERRETPLTESLYFVYSKKTSDNSEDKDCRNVKLFYYCDKKFKNTEEISNCGFRFSTKNANPFLEIDGGFDLPQATINFMKKSYQKLFSN